MKITKEEKKQIQIKFEVLTSAKKQLKSEFVGLDDVIDEITDLIEPWFLFPESQLRPTIINLWGMTGVGKTSLVVRLFEILDIFTIYKFDIGDFCNDNSETKLKYQISNKITKLKKDDRLVLVFDEFQLGRTMTDDGDEIDRGALRIIWELYDTGKIEIMNSSYNTTRMFLLSEKLELCINNNVTSFAGVVNGNEDFFYQTFSIKKNKLEKEIDRLVDDDDDDDDDVLYFIPDYFLWTITEIWENRFYNTNEVREYLKRLNEKETIGFINETLELSIKPVIHDFSNTIIFNIGNLDEAYRLANDVNPDSDADFLYEYTKKISLPQIKTSLLRRYRPEQISRLGNNHVIYKSFNCTMYRELIKLQLVRFKDKVNEKFNLNIICDESVHDIIYREGVFPTQGTRPVFSTIVSLIETYTGKIISDIIKEDILDVDTIKWAYSDKKHLIQFMCGDKNLYSKKYPVLLKTETLRENTKDDIQALVAIHEAGHVVCGMMSIGILPKHVVSRTADASAGGFCMLELPDFRSAKLIRDTLVYTLGGYMAEKLTFGEDAITTGSYGDISTTTNEALLYVKSYGMCGDPVFFCIKSAQTIHDRIDDNIIDADREAYKLVKNAEKEAERILRRESKLLHEIARYLSENSRMGSELLKEFHDKYAVEKVDFKTKENYHNFKKILGELK